MTELLRLAEVNKSFRRGSQELHVLRNASLEVARGEMVCVLGSRGQGKTTLLRITAGMESADAGLVSFDGQDLATLSDRELSRLLGDRIAWAGRGGPGIPTRMLDYVAMPLLVGRRARANRRRSMRLAPKRHPSIRSVDARARAALERVGAAGCGEQLWENISDWERALVEVAQAIAGEPALLLIDDLTDTLGMRETEELTALLRSLSRELQMGILMSVSDPQATLLSDRIKTLASGRLTSAPQSSSGNVIEFPDLSASRRDAERGNII